MTTYTIVQDWCSQVGAPIYDILMDGERLYGALFYDKKEVCDLVESWVKSGNGNAQVVFTRSVRA